MTKTVVVFLVSVIVLNQFCFAQNVPLQTQQKPQKLPKDYGKHLSFLKTYPKIFRSPKLSKPYYLPPTEKENVDQEIQEQRQNDKFLYRHPKVKNMKR